IKSDLTVRISGGSVNLTATGDGAKGIKANGAVELNGGDLHIALSGNAITGGGDSATPKGIKADGNLMINGGGNYVSACGAGSIGIESGYGMVIDGGVTYTFGSNMGILFGSTGAYCSGVVLAGGESNSDFNSAYTMSLTNVQSQTISKIMSEDGKELIGSFRWPVAMKSASLTILK
ncbi:MAG: carbohydrate-binding domain-containing protein, partial [Muribaculaceae bacterium]|nr:carbohydrate-binding domain-containing protein [Muribaculaceae bacterium]